MVEDDYEEMSTSLLESIVGQIEEVDFKSSIDIDYDGEVLTIDSGEGQYVINRHSAAKQIWMVSPITGPHHFHVNDDEWVNDQDENILDILTDEFTNNIGIKIQFSNLSLIS
jgi:iron donor protein CyaY